MHARALRVAPFLLAAALAGCAAPAGLSLPQRRPLGADLETSMPPPADEPPAAPAAPARRAEAPTGDLTLRQALAAALRGNPELAGFGWAVRQAEADEIQAAALPNPELEAEFENFAGSGEFRGSGALETTVTLSQVILLGEKRARQRALAAHDSRLAGWDYEAKRLDVLTAVAGQFVDVLAGQQKLALAQEDLTLAESTFQTVEKRVDAGKASPMEKSKAAVERASGRVRAGRAERELAAARQKLAALWGGREATFARAVGSLEQVAALPSVESLVARLSQNPQLARWSEEIARRRAALEWEKAQAVPDVTVGVGYRHFRGTPDNDRAMLLTLGAPLPVFDQNRGGIARARLGVLKAASDRHAAEVHARAELEQSYQALAAAHAEAVALRDEILPAARQAFEAAQESFRQGKAGYLDVLDAQRTLIEARQEHAEALASYHQAVAALEGLTAQPLDPAPAAGPQPKETIDEAKN
ncbi:MAG TPA: TolC family protein [Phycisphaerae bacterium]|nr:TolC family protein [Phycisphaerae bacterium]